MCLCALVHVCECRVLIVVLHAQVTLPIFAFMMWWRDMQQRRAPTADSAATATSSEPVRLFELRSMNSTGTLPLERPPASASDKPHTAAS